MARTIEVDERVFDALEDVARFCGTFEQHFTRDWRDTIESFDDLWRKCVRSFYGDAVDTDDGLKPEDKIVFIEPALCAAFLFSQLDYRKEETDEG